LKRRETILALFAGALVALALLTVFAIELSNTQAKSKNDVKARVHERAVLAAALIDSLFQSVGGQIPQDERTYGTPVVSQRTMNHNLMTSAYLALLDSHGTVIAATRGFDAQARSNLANSAALGLLRTRHPYGLGDLQRYRKTGVIDFAVAFPTKYGIRTLLTGFAPSALSTFISGELIKIPGVKGSVNYLLDGNGAVLASTTAAHLGTQLSHAPAPGLTATDAGGNHFDQAALSNSTWRVVLSSPTGPLFASVTGLRKWVPWIIFVAFALVALLALALARRALRSTAEVRDAKARLEIVNVELADTNEALERRARELARSNAELEQFASIASHDLQEPLRKVRTFTQQLTVIESDRLSDKGREYLDRANLAAERMQKLIEDLLKFSRVATHGRPFADVDLADVTSEVLEDLEAQVKRSDAVVEVGELPTISADALQMRQLFQNLISNALKFKRAGVRPTVTIASTTLGDTLQITVRDNGIGFDQQYARRIFRVFERLHGRDEFPGTGIGLALCRKIAERHGGTVVAEGEPGVGSTFTVTLPLHQREEVIDSIDHNEDTRSADREEVNVPA
jgi:signal transduction histidine kinase